MAQCEGTSKRTGERCTRPTAKGGTLCAGHAGYGIAADPSAHASDGARAKAANARERAALRKETLLERISRQTEEKASEIVAAYFAAGAKGDWRALEALVTRVHGKPVERVEVEAPVDPFGVADMTPAERAQLVASVLTRFPELEPLTGTPVVHKGTQPLQ